MDSGHKLELVKYRDAGMPTYTYFYTINKKVVSPYFDSEQEAIIWLENRTKDKE
jgi:hypothetical protein